MIDVVSMGELLVEFVSTVPNTPLADVPGFIKAPGGAPANVAVGLHAWGFGHASSARSATIHSAFICATAWRAKGSIRASCRSTAPRARPQFLLQYGTMDARISASTAILVPICSSRRMRSTRAYSTARAASTSVRSGSSTNHAPQRSIARSTLPARAG